MFELIPYSEECKNDWDQIVNEARNGSFLFYRDYLEYHSDRFSDASYLVKRKNKLVAVIPGNISQDVFYSHQGLTYGGIIMLSAVTASDIISVYSLLNEELKNKGVRKVIIKPMPHIYHKVPSQEEIYVLFCIGAEKIGCNISSTIYQNNKIKFSQLRRRGIKKSKKNGVVIEQSDDFKSFWIILNENLRDSHNAAAVHNVEEIEYLFSKFPQNIKLYTAILDGQIIAGTVIYEMSHIVHVQYISANGIGKELGALDSVFDHLINEKYLHISIFDFGQSTEQNGKYLNEGLIFQKEGFGGRGAVYETYEYQIK
ncbi:MAG: GNAT family N-acetyltransferase [Carboxylicivirga sp.]|jgi:hypothetical protein|nr:GNAT family N-acetyltransferase [Carboxylicivirga sp.]